MHIDLTELRMLGEKAIIDRLADDPSVIDGWRVTATH